ncbi:MAG: alpha/beta hydrolase [Gemmatimonadaceae bacterium]|nr:alpha/beta hydrolase [Gemmatimonadaceae bacterium]
MAPRSLAQRLVLALAWFSASTAGAQARVVRLPSRVLGETRVVHISVPPNYRLARQRYPVVVLLDGQARPFFDLAVAAVGYDLVGDARDFAMPPQIVVGIEQGDRSVDLSRNDVAFLRFLTDELLPYVDREYRTVPYRTLIGHSLGGRFALLALCRAPQQFSSTIAISPSVSDSVAQAVTSCLRQQAEQVPTRVRQLVLSAGSLESRSLAGVVRLEGFVRDSLDSRWRVTRVNGDGLGHTETPFVTIPAGLRFVFATAMWELGRTAADSLIGHRGDPRNVLDQALAVVSARVGFGVAPSSKWMAEVVRGYLARGALDSAVVAGQRMTAAYPEELLGYALLADGLLARRDNGAARRALTDALSMLDKLEWFDETQRERQRVHFRQALAGIVP